MSIYDGRVCRCSDARRAPGSRPRGWSHTINDIGTAKLPAWIEGFCGAKPEFSFTSGGKFPENLSQYALIGHCGGCMLTETAMKHRIERAVRAGVPIVNYGVAIAQMYGILKRSVQLFPDILALLD